MTSHARQSIAQQLSTNGTPHAIGTDQGVALNQLPCTGANGDDIVLRAVAADRLVQVQMDLGQALQGLQQDLMQVRPVNHDVTGTIALHHLRPQRQTPQILPCHGIAGSQPCRHSDDLLQRSLQPPGLQAAHHIGAQLNTRSNLGKLSCTLIKAHIPVCPRCSNSGRQPPDTAPCDQHLLIHGRLLCRVLIRIRQAIIEAKANQDNKKARRGGLLRAQTANQIANFSRS